MPRLQTHKEARKLIKKRKLRVTEVVSHSGKTTYNVITQYKNPKKNRVFCITVPERTEDHRLKGLPKSQRPKKRHRG